MADPAAAAVRERPILFSGRLVRGLLEGRKSVTRRVINPQPTEKWGHGVHQSDGRFYVHGRFDGIDTWFACPYGAPGDRLWVRETHHYLDARADWSQPPQVGWLPVHLTFQADDTMRTVEAPAEDWTESWCNDHIRWRPSIHLHRWASRISLEVTEVRVERLQDITDEEAIAEGVPTRGTTHWAGKWRDEFHQLWDELNAARGYGWDANPWVWVIRFRKVDP